MKKLNLPKENYFIGPAAVWKRIAAFAIDALVINMFIVFPFERLFRDSIPKNFSFKEAYSFMSTADEAYLTLVSIFVSALVILYFFLLERSMGQSIGKKIMNICVVADDNKLTSWKVFLRSIVFIPVFPFFILWVADPLFMIFNKTGQRLSEVLSKTRVVERYKYSTQEW